MVFVWLFVYVGSEYRFSICVFLMGVVYKMVGNVLGYINIVFCYLDYKSMERGLLFNLMMICLKYVNCYYVLFNVYWVDKIMSVLLMFLWESGKIISILV